MEQDRKWMRHMWYRINDTIREQKKTKKILLSGVDLIGNA